MAFFCEVAATFDKLFDGPGGHPLQRGWWKKDFAAFKYRRTTTAGSAASRCPSSPQPDTLDADWVSSGNAERLRKAGSPLAVRGRLRVVDAVDLDARVVRNPRWFATPGTSHFWTRLSFRAGFWLATQSIATSPARRRSSCGICRAMPRSRSVTTRRPSSRPHARLWEGRESFARDGAEDPRCRRHGGRGSADAVPGGRVLASGFATGASGRVVDFAHRSARPVDRPAILRLARRFHVHDGSSIRRHDSRRRHSPPGVFDENRAGGRLCPVSLAAALPNRHPRSRRVVLERGRRREPLLRPLQQEHGRSRRRSDRSRQPRRPGSGESEAADALRARAPLRRLRGHS